MFTPSIHHHQYDVGNELYGQMLDVGDTIGKNDFYSAAKAWQRCPREWHEWVITEAGLNVTIIRPLPVLVMGERHPFPA